MFPNEISLAEAHQVYNEYSKKFIDFTTPKLCQNVVPNDVPRDFGPEIAFVS